MANIHSITGLMAVHTVQLPATVVMNAHAANIVFARIESIRKRK